MQPTELAVALRYEAGNGTVPTVTAKGRDAVGAPIPAALDSGQPIATPETAQLAAAAAEARRRVARGEAIDLLPLVQAVAAALVAGGRAGGASERAGLIALQDELDRLLSAVQQEHARARQSLCELTARGRAGRAYARLG